MSRTSAIAAQRNKPQTAAEEQGPTGAEWLLEVDPTLAAIFDQLDERLRAAQDEERARHTPIQWEDAQQELAAEQARLLVVGADAIDAIMNISDLGVYVARQAAGIETAYHMANLHRTVQRALPAPLVDVVAGGGNGGDGDPQVYDVAADTEDYRFLRANTDPEPTETGPDGYPVGTPPWDDPEGAHIVTERPRASSGHGPRWWTRIIGVATAGATLMTATILGAWTLIEQVRP